MPIVCQLADADHNIHTPTHTIHNMHTPKAPTPKATPSSSIHQRAGRPVRLTAPTPPHAVTQTRPIAIVDIVVAPPEPHGKTSFDDHDAPPLDVAEDNIARLATITSSKSTSRRMPMLANSQDVFATDVLAESVVRSLPPNTRPHVEHHAQLLATLQHRLACAEAQHIPSRCDGGV